MVASNSPNQQADSAAETPENGETTAVKSGFGVLPLAAISLLLVIAIPWGLWAVLRDPGPTPSEQFQTALELLAEGNNRDALRYIRPLDEMGYKDMDFAGGVEYVIGIIAFRDAEMPELPPSAKQRMYKMAIAYLREAERKTIDSTYHLEFSWALGTSLFRTGHTRESFPFLQSVFREDETHQVDASFMLAEAYLNPNVQPSEMDRLGFQERFERKIAAARKHNKIVAENTPQTLEQMKTATAEAQFLGARAKEQLIRIELAENQLPAAKATLAEWETIIKHLPSSNAPERRRMADDARLLEARLAIASQDFQVALNLLNKLARQTTGLDKELGDRAHYLLGVCHEKLGDVDAALNHYEQAGLEEDTDEAIAATLAAADLLRSEKAQHERALDLYGRVLTMIGDTESFNNRWLSLDQIRMRLRTAWEMWTRSGEVTAKNYKWAIQLSELMPPLFPQDYANEMAAQANVRWAEHLQDVYENSTVKQQDRLRMEMLEQWNRAGQAYAKLAYSRRAQENYPESLRLAYEMYHRGKDFDNALLMINEFLNSQPKNLLATALVHKGLMLMDSAPFGDSEALFQEAGDLFRSVITNSPKDPAAYTAHALLGQVSLELDRPDEAITIWRKVISNEALSPEATEWQYSLFSLGRTLYHTAEVRFHEADLQRADTKGDNNTNNDELELEGFKRLEEAIERLSEYLQRNPDGPDSPDAGWMLAKALQRLAERPRQKLATAETVNAKTELQKDIEELLNEAIQRYADIRGVLQPQESLDELAETEHRILRDAYFEPAHSLYILAEFDSSGLLYDKTIDAYSTAVNQFPQDAQILLAYYQIANCYHQMGRPDESRRQLERARVILQQLPDSSFTSDSTNYTRDDWKRLINNAIQFRNGQLETATAN